jgi:putative ABC transport system permease protein
VGSVSQACLNWQAPAAAFSSPNGVASTDTVVVDPAALGPLGYPVSAHARDLLRAGGVLVSNPALIRPDGTVPLTWYSADQSGTTEKLLGSGTIRVRAAVLPPPRIGQDQQGVMPVAMTAATADRLGVPWQFSQGVLAGVAPITSDQQDGLEQALEGTASIVELYTERGFVETFTIQLLALIIAAVLAVLIGTLTATGLALADARPDFATLSAVGAGPRTRRLMAGSHALTIGVLGALTGVTVGFVPGRAVTWPLTAVSYTGAASRGGPVIDIPWLLLLGVGVLVPLLAAVVMAGTTRSRLPIVRRLGE